MCVSVCQLTLSFVSDGKITCNLRQNKRLREPKQDPRDKAVQVKLAKENYRARTLGGVAKHKEKKSMPLSGDYQRVQREFLLDRGKKHLPV